MKEARKRGTPSQRTLNTSSDYLTEAGCLRLHNFALGMKFLLRSPIACC